MIDWLLVGFSALWIGGLSLSLASLSLANYRAYEERRKVGLILVLPVFRVMVNLGMTLFCLGMVGGASEVWEQLLWGILVLVFVVQTWVAWRGRPAK
jgi:hypothetical protein